MDKGFSKLSPVVREISWSRNLAVFQDVNQLKNDNFI
jgi:hypothetical protein